ncbi:MAG: HAD family phosphatase [Caldilineaceae bacterium]
MYSTQERVFDAIVFDLGGVLIELSGVDRMLELLQHQLTVEELWTRWLTSPAVHQFETGQIDADVFTTLLFTEFGITIDAAQFIAEFTSWPQGLYPGATDLLRALAPHYQLACLTNTNALHWPRICDEMGVLDHFTAHFASHEVGMVKPHPEIFAHVLDALGYAPERILFLDDNRLNVEAAQAVGISAHRVVGLAGAIMQLTALGILPVAGAGTILPPTV